MGVKITAFAAAILLILDAVGVLPNEYLHYALWALVAASAFIAYSAYDKGKHGWFWCMIFIAILFNPYITADFDWRLWRAIDILAAIAFFMSAKLP